ncbi:DUF6090 family protein [Algoriphagus namhaensis]|uniref:DUF6090 family protein n=1 Tax=Algoriphagus namhaensis TaxID=915353 RepID=A0ABV8ATQ4_9BACT
MIKFFRKIRQNLLSEGKTEKYLKYAVGEIILVVIGILIALSINNWNENIKKVEQEKVYYCKIKEDLQTDIKNIQRGIKSLDERIVSAKKVLINLYQKVDDKSILLEGFIPAVRSYDFIPSKSAILDITSSGKLENFSNSKLKTSILQHYSDLEYLMNVLQQNQKGFSALSFKYEDFSAFGYHQIPLYKDNYGEELLSLMPNVNWQKDTENILFKQFQDHINMSVIISAREKELLKQILSSTVKLETELESNCNNSTK